MTTPTISIPLADSSSNPTPSEPVVIAPVIVTPEAKPETMPQLETLIERINRMHDSVQKLTRSFEQFEASLEVAAKAQEEEEKEPEKESVQEIIPIPIAEVEPLNPVQKPSLLRSLF